MHRYILTFNLRFLSKTKGFCESLVLPHHSTIQEAISICSIHPVFYIFMLEATTSTNFSGLLDLLYYNFKLGSGYNSGKDLSKNKG